MYVSLTPELVQYDKAVYLRKDMPTGQLFGNRNVILAKTNGYQTKGTIVSYGFEAGMVRVNFPFYEGDETTQINELSAKEYLH